MQFAPFFNDKQFRSKIDVRKIKKDELKCQQYYKIS